MLIELENHLKQTTPVEMFDLFRRAHDLFDKYDWEHAQDAFADLLISSDGEQGSATTSAFYDLTVEILTSILTEHQITLADGCGMEPYIIVLEYIKQIEFTEFVTESVNLLSSDDFNNSEKLCEHMALVIGGDALTYMEWMEDIPDAVINKIKEYFTDREAAEIAIEGLPEEQREVYTHMETFARAVAGKEMASYIFLMENGGAVGMPLSFYWKLHEAYLKTLPDEDLIYELIGFGMMAQGGLDDVMAVVNEQLGAVFSNIDHLVKLQNILTTTLVQYRNEISTGVSKTAVNTNI